MHVDFGKPVIIGGITVGHGAMIHGAEIGNGNNQMRATVLNSAKIGNGCIIPRTCW